MFILIKTVIFVNAGKDLIMYDNDMILYQFCSCFCFFIVNIIVFNNLQGQQSHTQLFIQSYSQRMKVSV